MLKGRFLGHKKHLEHDLLESKHPFILALSNHILFGLDVLYLLVGLYARFIQITS